MPFPPEWPVVEVRVGPYLGTDGRSMEDERVTFEPRVKRLRLLDDTIIVRRTTIVTLDENGEGVALLPVSDDPDISANGWTWHVREKFRHGKSYDIEVLTADVAAGIDLNDRAPVVPDTAYEDWRDGFRDEMEDLRDDAAAIVGLPGTDAAFAAAAQNAGGVGPLTSAIFIREAPLSPYRYGLTEAMSGVAADAASVNAAMQATLDALPAQNGAMRIPRGAWHYTIGISTSGRQFVIEGEGRHATSLRPVDGAAVGIHVLADTALNYGSGVIRDLTIGPVVVTPNPGVGIKVEGAYAADVLLEDLWIGSMSTGVWFAGVPNCAISRTIIEACQGAGLYASGSKILTISELQTFQNQLHGIYLDNCQGVTVSDGKQIENYGHGLFAAGGGGIHVADTLFDNNSKQFAFDPLAPGYATYDNVQFQGVNEGSIADTLHITSLGSPFPARAIDIDATSYRVDVMGGTVRAGAVAVDSIRNLAGEGQVITRERVALRSPFRVGSIYLRDNAGVLEKSTDGSTWSAV